MSVLRRSIDAVEAAERMDAILRQQAEVQDSLRLSKLTQDEAARQRRNLASRAKRRGVPVSVQAQREWIKANPCGFEIGD